MKKILLIVIFMAAMLVRGQKYVPLLDTNKVWNIHHDWTWEGFTYPYYLEISKTDNTKFILKEERHSQDIKEVGFLTEDTITQKVYYIDENNDEMLLYDFSLVEGDFFEYVKVTKVDSIQLLDGTYRKRIEFEDGFYSYWIEGIGSIKGGILRINWHDIKNTTAAWLLCYYENDSLLYINNDFDSCNISFVIDEVETLENSSSPLIYPNPFDKILSISFDKSVYGEKPEVFVKALDGRTVYHEIRNSDSSLDLSFLDKGIYLLVLTNKDLQYIMKIIKL